MKKCTKCKQEKAKDEFHKNTANKDGLQCRCKACEKAYRDRNVRTNPRRSYVNQTRASIHDGAIEVKLYGDNDAWTILDLEDFERFHNCRFYLKGCYAAIVPELKYVRLHKAIVDYPIVDHINRDKLDNRKANLRAATKSQNGMNRSRSRNNTSGFRGVHWCKRAHFWVAMIQISGRKRFLGYFDNAIDAAKTYDAAAAELHGDFAVLNFGRSDDACGRLIRQLSQQSQS